MATHSEFLTTVQKRFTVHFTGRPQFVLRVEAFAAQWGITLNLIDGIYYIASDDGLYIAIKLDNGNHGIAYTVSQDEYDLILRTKGL